MGKQIRFFMTAGDELSFIRFVNENNDLMMNDVGIHIDEMGDPVIYESGKSLDKKILTKVFIYKLDSKIFKRSSGFVDELLSEVIEFSRCSIRNDNQLWNGRIWVETKYYDEKGQIVKKPDWLNKKYNEYKKWITKNLRPNKDKEFYIGEEAYKLYKEKGFKMKNAPKVSIEFD